MPTHRALVAGLDGPPDALRTALPARGLPPRLPRHVAREVACWEAAATMKGAVPSWSEQEDTIPALRTLTALAHVADVM